MTVERVRPRIVCWPSNDVDDKIDLSGDVLGFTATNAINTPAGSFSLTLSPRPSGPSGLGRVERTSDLGRRIRPNAVISIGYRYAGGIMIGLVSSVTESMTLVGGRTQRTLTISGHSMGRLLTQDTIVNALLVGPDSEDFRKQVEKVVGPNNPVLGLVTGLRGPLRGRGDDAVNTFAGADVRSVVRWILTNVPTMRLPIMGTLYGDPNPGAWIYTDRTVKGQTLPNVTTWNDARVWSDAMSVYNGNVWGYLTSAVDLDFYDVFLDTRRSDVGDEVPDIDLIMRPKPFDCAAWETTRTPVREQTGLTWDDLRTRITGAEHHVLPLDVVHQASLTVSEDEIYSWYQVTCDYDPMHNSDAQALGLAYPMLDLYAMQRWGVRPYNARLALLGADIERKSSADDDAYTGAMIDEVREFRNRLVNWHRYNAWLVSGTVVVDLDDDIRPGDPVYLPWAEPTIGTEQGLRFYCTAVTWSWSIAAAPTCTLTLSRGSNPGMIDAIQQKIRLESNVTVAIEQVSDEIDELTGKPMIEYVSSTNSNMLVGA